jgi:hypothetical protein
MTREQYRELCRLFIADQFNVYLGHIRPGEVANPVRSGRTRYWHRVDLQWVSENALSRYVHVAHACWRDTAPLGLAAVLGLQKVREKLAAHKAVLITNTCFTPRAVAAAEDDGIALFLVRPLFDYGKLTPRGDTIREIEMLTYGKSDPYTFEIVR